MRTVLAFVALSLSAGALGAQRPAPRPAAAAPAAASPALDTTLYGAMRWRNVGPFRGGRATAVAGVTSNMLTYYMGGAGGGVWKTEDAGNNWRNITDGFLRTGTVGSIAVSESDPNVIYAGMGEAPVRGQSSSYGDGVYKSTDAGRTWTHIGLEMTRQISRIRIHPDNPDVVYVAAQGSRWAPTAERGIYRSTDGGKTWKLLLHVADNSGPSELAMDATNPRILYAAFWEHQRTPWQVRSGGPNSGIWKTTDGGETWTRLTEGLPRDMGKIGVAVSPVSPDRVWAIVEADEGGLYRSDNAGRTWQRTSDDRVLRARAWYYTAITADPQSADVVYVINAPLLKSTDGGRTFTTVNTPHGDNHQLWINPRNASYMINANDGGANISLNGGRTWSTQGNQPTAQFYRVNTDNRFLYHLYGGQQDNTTVEIASRTSDAGIDRPDWHPVGGCESAHVAFDPDNPRYVYAGCYHGIISEHDEETDAERNIMAWPALGLGEPSDSMKYRFNWSAPILTSPHDRKVIYHAGNVLFRSSDRGQHWTPISPDLTRNDKSKQGLGGTPITNEGAGGEVYNTIYYVVESPHQAGTIWVGTDDGLVQLTRDGGKTWKNVTPPNIGEALVNAIELSPHDSATAYATITRVKWNDNTPHIFRTTDFGRTWRDLTTGIRAGDVVRVVREDPARRGLLYAGSETGAYVSFDGGARWQTLQLNLPAVPVTDLQVHANDLVASTEGRAFWILDDLTPLQQMTDEVARGGDHLFKPRTAYRVAGSSAELPGVGQNPAVGATLFYVLAAPHDTTDVITLDILDGAGKTVRHYSSKRGPAVVAPGAEPQLVLPAKKGMNRVVWDLRRESVTRVPGMFLAQSPLGPHVVPGTYQARLTSGGKALTQPVEVRLDPRITIAEADLKQRDQLALAIYARVNEIHEAAMQLRDVRDQVTALDTRADALPNGAAVRDAGKKIVTEVNVLEERLVQPKAKTFQDVINFRRGLNDQLLFLGEAVDGTESALTQGVTQRMEALDAAWSVERARISKVLDQDVPAFNALVKQSNAPAVIVKRATPAAVVP